MSERHNRSCSPEMRSRFASLSCVMSVPSISDRPAIGLLIPAIVWSKVVLCRSLLRPTRTTCSPGVDFERRDVEDRQSLARGRNKSLANLGKFEHQNLSKNNDPVTGGATPLLNQEPPAEAIENCRCFLYKQCGERGFRIRFTLLCLHCSAIIAGRKKSFASTMFVPRSTGDLHPPLSVIFPSS